ncbi:hypothetical protein HHI36_008384 [Cryptolaemus montrouzieri]|uniref:Uncharacterized protein n=1 Tax=Cryptolaemus montrouzieri TaxID=559131 RepID=A0ABD2MS77_9CUCU
MLIENTLKLFDEVISSSDIIQLTYAVETKEPQTPERPSEAVDFFAAPENQVRVYEPKSSSKTWNDTLNLGSISLGEDPLGISTHDYNMVDADDFLKDISPGRGDATVNTLRDIKDFQENTVNTVVKPMSHATSQALHKIGDLQDEAAGVVEGLFDFGMAGIRKGLKLTGLQEHSAQEAVMSEIKSKVLLSSPGVKHNVPVKKIKKHHKQEVVEECVWVNPLQSYPNFSDDVHEEHSKSEQIPAIMMDSESESPDPEYEEAADLATTIAKLRLLLQQKSESTSTTPVASPMISEDSKSVVDLDDVDSFVPSFYKFCAKTATGVFNNTLNTIKTALPVNTNDTMIYDVEKWDYEDSDDNETDLLIRMYRLLHERKDFCTIEAAYDAFDSQHPLKIKNM